MKIRQKTNYVSIRSAELYSYSALKNIPFVCILFLGLNLSRAIGDHAYKTNKELPLSEQMISPVPDVKKLTIDPEKDSFVLLACDGIWNSLSSQETVDFISTRLNKKNAKHDTTFLTNILKEVRHIF